MLTQQEPRSLYHRGWRPWHAVVIGFLLSLLLCGGGLSLAVWLALRLGS